MVQLECDIAAQNCASLFSRTTSLIKLPYGAGSCARDARLPGNVGRCGFPGAACVTDAQGNDNCAYGGDSTKPNYKPLCQKGICGGGIGAVCTNGDFDCNWGYYCNATAPNPGVCGGQGSFVSDQGDGGDFAADYCLSGKASLASNGFWYCVGGQFLASIPSGPSSSSTPLPSSPSRSSSIIIPISSGNDISSASQNPPISTSSKVNGAQSTDASAISAPGSPPLSGSSSSSTGSNTATDSQATDLSSNTNNSGGNNVAGTHTSSNSKTPIIAGVCAAVGIVLVALLAFLVWRHFRKQKKARMAVEDISYPVPAQPSGFSDMSQQPPASFATTSGPASIPAATSSFGYLPEIQNEGGAAGQNTGSTYPSGYHPVAPSSPHYNFPATASNPSLPQDPFMNPPAEIAYRGTGPSSGNLDATERHLLAVREEAERHLREYNQRGH